MWSPKPEHKPNNPTRHVQIASNSWLLLLGRRKQRALGNGFPAILLLLLLMEVKIKSKESAQLYFRIVCLLLMDCNLLCSSTEIVGGHVNIIESVGL